MPVVSITLDENDRSILVPSYQKIIKDLMSVIKVPTVDLVMLHHHHEFALTDNHANAVSNQKDNLPTTASKRRILVKVSENYNEDEIATTAINQKSAFPFFADPDIDVYVAPIYVKNDIEFEFTYTSPSLSEASNVRDDIRMRLSQTRNIGIHDVSYTIIIPELVEDFIGDVYDLKNRLFPQSLETYFRSNSSKRIHPVTDLAGVSNSRLGISETQARIVGIFDINTIPDKMEIDNDTNTYQIKFVYKFSLDVPTGIVMRYPVMICNHSLPYKYYEHIINGKLKSNREHKRDLNYNSFSLYNLSHFESHRQISNRLDNNMPINVPHFDEFNQRVGHIGYGINVSFLTEIDETDKRTLLDLKNIQPFEIDRDLLQFLLAGEKQYVVSPYKSFIFIGLHQDDRHFDNDILEITDDLVVRCKKDLDLVKPTRVTISVIIDISYLTEETLVRFTSNFRIFKLFIDEFITSYINFKQEVAWYGGDISLHFRTLVKLLVRFTEREQIELIKILMRALYVDLSILKEFCFVLSYNFPNLTEQLLKIELTDADIASGFYITPDTLTNKNYGSKKILPEEYLQGRFASPVKHLTYPRAPNPNTLEIEPYVMKTVLNNFVQAERMPS